MCTPEKLCQFLFQLTKGQEKRQNKNNSEVLNTKPDESGDIASMEGVVAW